MSMLGTRVARKEDPELLTTGGKYVDDIAPPDALHAVFVRSLVAHAEITEINTAEAKTMPGVVAVYTEADIDQAPRPPRMPLNNQAMVRPWLASGRVRYVGEAIVMVLAETRAAAVDAAEMVFVDYEPLDVVLSLKEFQRDEMLLFPDVGTNTIFAVPGAGTEGLFDDCDVVTELTFRNRPMSSAPMEPRGVLGRA